MSENKDRNLKLLCAVARSGLTCREVAAKAGVSRSSVSGWMRKRRRPRTAQAAAVARILGVTPKALGFSGGVSHAR
jgi:transcriptional regulator with XRE-family HTH domain